MVFLLARALTYATLFIGVVLVLLPSRMLAGTGLVQPPSMGMLQIVGLLTAAVGAALTVWCVLTFVFVGRGTPAPFDPPRRLVVRGPYRMVRNPMYIAAALLLTGAALFYGSMGLVGYAGVFLLVMHMFVISYEEPTLRETFGGEYDAYCRRVARWRPRASWTPAG
jgi:protein-S-isoprenylcysteine O-methyltransferase Ste14